MHCVYATADPDMILDISRNLTFYGVENPAAAKAYLRCLYEAEAVCQPFSINCYHMRCPILDLSNFDF